MSQDDSAYRDAATAWIALLSSFGEPAAVERALAPDVVVERHGFGKFAGQIAERLEGHDAVARWADMSNRLTEFELVGSVTVDREREPPEGRGRYLVRVPEFEGGGAIRFSLAEDGRIRRLAHLPDDLDDVIEEFEGHDEWRRIVAHAKKLRGAPRPPIEMQPSADHDHDHDHDHDLPEADPRPE